MGINLQEVRLSHNLLTHIPLCLKDAPALKTLDLGHNQIFEWKNVESIGSLRALTNLNLAGNPISDRDQFVETIRELGKKIKILNGIKIVDDLRKRKRKNRPKGLEKEPNAKKQKKNDDKEEKKKIRKDVAPTIIRGRVSSGKRMVLDDSDDESEPIQEKTKKPEKQTKEIKKINQDKDIKPISEEKEEKYQDNKEEKKNIEKEEKKEKEIDPLEEIKKKSSGIRSISNIKTNKKNTSNKVEEVSDLFSEEPSIGLGNQSQW